MERRDLLKTAGGIGATTLMGGASLFAMSGGAAATSEFNFTAEDISEGFGDGDVSNVYVDIDGELSWSNFDEEVTQMAITIESRIWDADEENVIDGWTVERDGDARDPVALPDDVAGKEGSYSGQVGSPKLSLTDDRGTSLFDVGADGESSTVVVELRLTIDLLNSDGERADPKDKARVQESATFAVTTTNKPASTSGSATAKATAE